MQTRLEKFQKRAQKTLNKAPILDERVYDALKRVTTTKPPDPKPIRPGNPSGVGQESLRMCRNTSH